MSTLMFASASGAKIAATVPGLSGRPGQRHPGLILVIGDAGDEVAFHIVALQCLVADHHRARPVIERGQHPDRHLLAHGKADRSGLQHLGADRCQLEHLLEGDDGQLARARHDAGSVV
jgi:hypothetical protein